MCRGCSTALVQAPRIGPSDQVAGLIIIPAPPRACSELRPPRLRSLCHHTLCVAHRPSYVMYSRTDHSHRFTPSCTDHTRPGAAATAPNYCVATPRHGHFSDCLPDQDGGRLATPKHPQSLLRTHARTCHSRTPTRTHTCTPTGANARFLVGWGSPTGTHAIVLFTRRGRPAVAQTPPSQEDTNTTCTDHVSCINSKAIFQLLCTPHYLLFV